MKSNQLSIFTKLLDVLIVDLRFKVYMDIRVR